MVDDIMTGPLAFPFQNKELQLKQNFDMKYFRKIQWGKALYQV